MTSPPSALVSVVVSSRVALMTLEFEFLDRLLSFLANLAALVGSVMVMVRWLRGRERHR
jgi:hypothetical protein